MKHFEVDSEPILSLSGLEINFDSRKIFVNNQEIDLTQKEYDILVYLLQNVNRVLTFTQIYEHVWKEPDYGTSQEVVSHHVRSLRRKLQLNEKSGCRISSVRGIGYRSEKINPTGFPVGFTLYIYGYTISGFPHIPIQGEKGKSVQPQAAVGRTKRTDEHMRIPAGVDAKSIPFIGTKVVRHDAVRMGLTICPQFLRIF